jgi:hypothetical protein
MVLQFPAHDQKSTQNQAKLNRYDQKTDLLGMSGWKDLEGFTGVP